jgi:hypothetical protein
MKYITSVRGFKLLRTNYLKSFNMIDRRDIVLDQIVGFGGLLSFDNMVTCAFFKLSEHISIAKVHCV